MSSMERERAAGTGTSLSVVGWWPLPRRRYQRGLISDSWVWTVLAIMIVIVDIGTTFSCSLAPGVRVPGTPRGGVSSSPFPTGASPPDALPPSGDVWRRLRGRALISGNDDDSFQVLGVDLHLLQGAVVMLLLVDVLLRCFESNMRRCPYLGSSSNLFEAAIAVTTSLAWLGYPVPLTLGRLSRPVVKIRRATLSRDLDSDYSSESDNPHESFRDLEDNGSSVQSDVDFDSTCCSTQTCLWASLISLAVTIDQGITLQRFLNADALEDPCHLPTPDLASWGHSLQTLANLRLLILGFLLMDVALAVSESFHHDVRGYIDCPGNVFQATITATFLSFYLHAPVFSLALGRLTKPALALRRSLLARQNSDRSEKSHMLALDETYVASDVLAAISYLEASTLLGKSAPELMAFFEERGCADIGRCLHDVGVSGASISMLLPANIDAMPLSLGQQLALKSFVERMKLVSTGARHWQEIWSGEEFKPPPWEEPPPCCDCQRCFARSPCFPCAVFCGLDMPPQKVYAFLPLAQYTLTDAVLKVTTSEWLDVDEEDEKTRRRRPAVFKKNCCGYQREPDPPKRTLNDIIDLICIQDVNYTVQSPIMEVVAPAGLCTGPEKREVTIPAKIMITYIECGNGGLCTETSDSPNNVANQPFRKQLDLMVHPDDVKGVSEVIVAAVKEARANVRTVYNLQGGSANGLESQAA